MWQSRGTISSLILGDKEEVWREVWVR
jgi:hypothetical protein